MKKIGETGQGAEREVLLSRLDPLHVLDRHAQPLGEDVLRPSRRCTDLADPAAHGALQAASVCGRHARTVRACALA